MKVEVSDVLNFWYQELKPQDWFIKSSELDLKIENRFLDALEKTIAGEYSSWRESAHGALAQVIVLDQFSRNIFRDSPKSFAQDPLALAISQEAIRRQYDVELMPSEKAFLYMPFMHSESVKMHEIAVRLFSQEGLENNLEFEYKHKKIIDKFGRYPHRNKILGRQSTLEEEEFLKTPNSSF